jgi:phosphoribosylformylglycinamidine synthase
VVGSVRTDDQVFIRQADEVLFTASRGELQQQWARTSYTMQRRRDSAACADEEFASLVSTRDENPGLSARLTFDPSQAPAVISAGSPTIAILREQGVNGQVEMAAAFTAAGFDCVDLHMSDLSSGARQPIPVSGRRGMWRIFLRRRARRWGRLGQGCATRRQPAPAVC